MDRCIIGEGAEIYGEIHSSVIGPAVRIEEGAVVRDSIIMQECCIGRGAQINRAVISSYSVIGDYAVLGTGENAPNVYDKNVYAFGLVTVGENTVIPSGVRIGRNTTILGETKPEDYQNGELPGGGAIIKRKEGEAS